MLEQILEKLRALGEPSRAANQSLFIKGALEVWGAPVPEMRKLTREIPEPEAWELLPNLWEVRVREPRLLAVLILQRYAKRRPERVVEEGLKLAGDLCHWEETDQLAIALGEASLKLGNWEELSQKLVEHPNPWAKRLGLVLLLKPLRKGLVPKEFVEAQIERLKGEKDGLMKKAIAWVKREMEKL